MLPSATLQAIACDPMQRVISVQADIFSPELSGVPETMLWTLHDRASETLRADRVLDDPRCLALYRMIDYDFTGKFGAPSRFASIRAAETDRVIRRWLLAHPCGEIVSLGEGLETQAMRVDNGKMRWLTVDLPDAIRVREHFIRPTDRFRHLPMSATDLEWMQSVDEDADIFIVAQGLLMYLPPDRVRHILASIDDRLSGSEMVFDTIPKWYSETPSAHRLSGSYTVPPMPWGIDRNDIKPQLRSWCRNIKSIRFLRYRLPTGRPMIVEDILDRILPRRWKRNCLVHVTFRHRRGSRSRRLSS